MNELSKNDFLFGFSIVVLVIFLCLLILVIFHILREVSREKQESVKPIGRKLKINIGGNELVGIAGEDLSCGDYVVIGEDGKIHRAKNNV